MLALRLLSEGGEGLNTELLWVLMILLGFFALAIVVGWVSSLRKPQRAEVEVEAVSGHGEESVADDLVKIEGIGPKVAKVLARAGIITFEDLAHAKAVDIQKILDKAGMQMMSPEGWIDQAKLAAKGDWDALAKMQKQLKGGRKKK